MKKLLLIFLTFPLFSSAQKYTLIDKGWERSAQYVDTVTKAQLQDGWYPVYSSEVDSLITLISSLKTLFNKGMKRTYLDNNSYQTKNIQFDITNVQKAYGDRYNIIIISTTDAAKVKFRLSNPDYTNRINQQRIKIFLDYLEKSALSF